MKPFIAVFDERGCRIEKDPAKIANLRGQSNVLYCPKLPAGVSLSFLRLVDGKIVTQLQPAPKYKMPLRNRRAFWAVMGVVAGMALHGLLIALIRGHL